MSRCHIRSHCGHKTLEAVRELTIREIAIALGFFFRRPTTTPHLVGFCTFYNILYSLAILMEVLRTLPTQLQLAVRGVIECRACAYNNWQELAHQRRLANCDCPNRQHVRGNISSLEPCGQLHSSIFMCKVLSEACICQTILLRDT